MKKISLLLFLGTLAICSCKKYVKEDDLNNEAVLNFPAVQGQGFVGQLTYTNYPEFSYLIDFDKRDYPKFDSITFNAIIAIDPMVNSYNAYDIRIFNVTDSVEISNSGLSIAGSQHAANQIHTNNIYNSLPQKKITISIQGKGTGAVYDAFLKLRRK